MADKKLFDARVDLVTGDDACLLALLYQRYPPPTRFDEYNITANFDAELLAAMRYLGVRRLKTRYAVNRGAEVVVRAMLERVRDRPFGADDRWLTIGRTGWCSMVSTSAVILDVAVAVEFDGRHGRTLEEMISAINADLCRSRTQRNRSTLGD